MVKTQGMISMKIQGFLPQTTDSHKTPNFLPRRWTVLDQVS